jgi:hypothetical protein
VPAQVEGSWSFREADGNGRFALQLQQQFQHLSGRGESEPLVSDARMHGPQLELTFFEKGSPTRVVGRVDGDRIDAQVTRGGKTSKYLGTRAQ